MRPSRHLVKAPTAHPKPGCHPSSDPHPWRRCRRYPTQPFTVSVTEESSTFNSMNAVATRTPSPDISHAPNSVFAGKVCWPCLLVCCPAEGCAPSAHPLRLRVANPAESGGIRQSRCKSTLFALDCRMKDVVEQRFWCGKCRRDIVTGRAWSHKSVLKKSTRIIMRANHFRIAQSRCATMEYVSGAGW